MHSWTKLRLESQPEKEIEIATQAFEMLVSGLHVPGELRGRMCMGDWIFEQRVMPHIDAMTENMAM